MGYKETDLMRDIISLIEHRWVSEEQVYDLANKAEIEGVQQKISFFRELKRVIRLFPPEVFTDEEQRQNLITSVQQAQDKAIDEEEDEINGMGE